MGSPDWNVSLVDIHLRKLLDIPEWSEMTEQIEWRVKQPSQLASVSQDLKCWGAWDSTCCHKAKDITPSIAWRSEAWEMEALDDLPSKDDSGPSSVGWTLEPFLKVTLWKLLRDRMERINYIPTWTELNWARSWRVTRPKARLRCAKMSTACRLRCFEHCSVHSCFRLAFYLGYLTDLSAWIFCRTRPF